MSLEIWDAIRYVRPFERSRTKPLLLECERRSPRAGADVPTLLGPAPLLDPSWQLAGEAELLSLAEGDESEEAEEDEPAAQSREFVVKSLGHPEVLEESLFKELFGNVLAREFGIATPTPAIVVLSEPFVAVTQPLLPPDIKLRVGYAAGCDYLHPLLPIGPELRLPSDVLAQAAQIYAFDMLTANPDRHSRNPNCALRDGQLVA